MFKKILVPLDGSELAEWALPTALKLAQAVQGEVILLRSTIPVYTTMPAIANEYDWVWPEYAREQMRTEAREYLEEIKESHALPEVSIQTMNVEGDAASMIVDTAVDQAVDLIVMSTHGWSGFKRWMLGSVTEHVLHTGCCPVLAIRSSNPIGRVAVTLDGSELAEEAIEPALALASALKVGVKFLRVSEPLPVGSEPSMQFEWDVSQEMAYRIGQDHRKEAETYLHEVVRRVDRYNVDVQSSVVEGQAEEKILEFAKLHGIDLIAMSTHGRSGLRRWLFGSVTAKIMRSFDGHMLIVRS